MLCMGRRRATLHERNRRWKISHWWTAGEKITKIVNVNTFPKGHVGMFYKLLHDVDSPSIFSQRFQGTLSCISSRHDASGRHLDFWFFCTSYNIAGHASDIYSFSSRHDHSRSCVVMLVLRRWYFPAGDLFVWKLLGDANLLHSAASGIDGRVLSRPELHHAWLSKGSDRLG